MQRLRQCAALIRQCTSLTQLPIEAAGVPSLAQLGPCARALPSLRDAAIHNTTVICIRKNDQVVIMADGQATQGSAVIKPNVRKTRRLGERVIGAFAGSTADGLTLFDRLEVKLEEHPDQLLRAAVELAKQWRTDKYLRTLDAVVVVADEETSLQITGNGDVLEPHDGIIAIGSGGPYALAAARALIDMDGLDALTIAQKAMMIAADTCVYTNHNFTTETLDVSTASGNA